MSASDSPPRSRRLIASRCWCGVSLGGRPIFCPRATARARPSPVRVRIRSRSNSASPPSTVSISRPVRRRGVGPCGAKRAETSLAACDRAASVFNRSRVDRASRSSRVTINTSPASWTPSNLPATGPRAAEPGRSGGRCSCCSSRLRPRLTVPGVCEPRASPRCPIRTRRKTRP